MVVRMDAYSKLPLFDHSKNIEEHEEQLKNVVIAFKKPRGGSISKGLNFSDLRSVTILLRERYLLE